MSNWHVMAGAYTLVADSASAQRFAARAMRISGAGFTEPPRVGPAKSFTFI